MATMNLPIPLNITGNTTQEQQENLERLLSEAVAEASRAAIERLDRHSAELVLEQRTKLKSEFAQAVARIVQQHTTSNKYRDEEASSTREYPPEYRERPVEAQVTALRKFFPTLGACMERLGRRPLPEGAEAWFAIPRWQVVAPTYNEAVELVLAQLGKRRKFANRVQGKLDPTYLRQTERTDRAFAIMAEQQPGNDILVVAAQMGRLHRGCSARRARVIMSGNEFGMDSFSVGCVLLTHPERLSAVDTLMTDCAGDEYSLGGDGLFDRVPLFDYDLGGLQFSVFYNDRARYLWGSPSGFLYQA